MAFVDHEEVDLVPVRARTSADTPQYQFGVRPEIGSDFESREVVLVIDDGPYWFELRGVSVRGVARRIARNEGGHDDSLAWYGIEPGRIVAWDYGAIREE